MAQYSNDPNLILKDLNARIEARILKVREDLMPQISTVAKSDGAYEKWGWPTSVPFMRKWLDQRAPIGVALNNVFQLDNEMFEASMELEGTMIEDSRIIELNSTVDEFTQRCITYPDYLISRAVEAGATSGNNAYDGNTFYGDTHLYANAGANNIDNKMAGTGTTFNQIKVDFAVALATLRRYLDDKGGLLNQQLAEGKSMLLIEHPPELEVVFRELLNNTMIPIALGTAGGASSDNVLRGIASQYSDGYLTNVNNWYLHIVGYGMRPFIFQDRSPLVIKTLGVDSEHYIKTNKVLVTAKRRFRIGYYDFSRSLKVVNS